jgi:hypothetical protein
MLRHECCLRFNIGLRPLFFGDAFRYDESVETSTVSGRFLRRVMAFFHVLTLIMIGYLHRLFDVQAM